MLLLFKNEMGEKMTKSLKFGKILYRVIRVLSLAMIGYSIAGLVLNIKAHRETNFDFILTQSVALFLLSFVPTLVERVFKVNLPIIIEIIYLLFTTACLLFGEIFEFYIRFSWWDNILHTFSGSFIAVLGFIIIYFLNERKGVTFRLSPGFIAIFCFCFALACECVWETFEFTIDGIFGSNMQRYKDNIDYSIQFSGRDALQDTMLDIIETMIGSSIFCVVGYLDMTLRKQSILKEYLYHADKDAVRRKVKALNFSELEEALEQMKKEKLLALDQNDEASKEAAFESEEGKEPQC